MTVHGVKLCSCGSPLRTYTEHSCVGCGRVSLHDVEDAWAFVQATINRGNARLTSDQRDELASEGVRALVKMAREYQPGRGGLDPATSRFSGYAAKFLPGKLSDALHRIMDDTLSTQPDGSRVWDVKPAQVSLDAMAQADGPGTDSIVALRHEDRVDEGNPGDWARLDAWWEKRREDTIRYSELRGQGFRNAEIADEMGLLPAQVKELERFARETLQRPAKAAA